MIREVASGPSGPGGGRVPHQSAPRRCVLLEELTIWSKRRSRPSAAGPEASPSPRGLPGLLAVEASGGDPPARHPRVRAITHPALRATGKAEAPLRPASPRCVVRGHGRDARALRGDSGDQGGEWRLTRAKFIDTLDRGAAHRRGSTSSRQPRRRGREERGVPSRKPGMEELEAFQRYWRETHGPLAATIPMIRRYV